MEESATLKPGHMPTSMKSTTYPSNNRSRRFPIAPPIWSPKHKYTNLVLMLWLLWKRIKTIIPTTDPNVRRVV